MIKYIVQKRHLYHEEVHIEAEDEDEARALVDKGFGSTDGPCFSGTWPSEDWDVDEE